MRKIYTVVFALMVLLSVTMSAMAEETSVTTAAPEESMIAILVIMEAPARDAPAVIPDAPAPRPADTHDLF